MCCSQFSVVNRDEEMWQIPEVAQASPDERSRSTNWEPSSDEHVCCFARENFQGFLDFLYSTSQSFEEIFVFMFFDREVRVAQNGFVLCSTCGSELDEDGEKAFLEDILSFVATENVKYLVPGSGMMENVLDFPFGVVQLCSCPQRPLYYAIAIKHPEAMRTLLKFGASVLLNDLCMEDPQSPVHPIVRILEAFEEDLYSTIPTDAVEECLRMEVTLEWLCVDLACGSEIWMAVQNCLKKLKPIEWQGYVAPLQHLCRKVIRDAVKRYHSLPHSLYSLNLPEQIKSYLALE